MSNECSTIVWKRQFGGMTRKLIAARLADHADDEGRGIWPSVERVAAQCDTSERTVQRILAEFVREGLLRIVHEGGRGRFDTRRYDFDMVVLRALPVAKWGDAARETPVKTDDVNSDFKGDTVSPLTGSKGDTVSSKGDTDDVLGCHSVTQTSIEPSNQPSKCAQARESGGVSRETWKRRLRKAHGEWPTYVSDSADMAEREWFNLAEDDRGKAADLIKAYVAECQRTGRSKFCAFAVYLREKRWQKLPENAVAALNGPGGVTVAKPYGKAWGAKRFTDLMRQPYGHFPPLTAFQKTLVAEGGETADRERLDRCAKYGWPDVNALHLQARSRKGAPADPSLEPLSPLFVSVGKASPIWEAWKAEHAARGWPWFGPDRDCPEFVYMPAPPGEPHTYATARDAVRAALARFETEHATITQKDAAE